MRQSSLLRALLLVLCAVVLIHTSASAAQWNAFVKESTHTYENGKTLNITAGTVASKSKVMTLKLEDALVCPLSKGAKIHRNIGQALFGDSMVDSGIAVQFIKPVNCAMICKAPLTPEAQKKLANVINGRYRMKLFLDSLPVLQQGMSAGGRVRTGFNVGVPSVIRDQSPLVFNHWKFTIHYFEAKDATEGPLGYRIVKFEVHPMSIERAPGAPLSCLHDVSKVQPAKSDEVVYTYSVTWKPSNIPWSTRWDVYMAVSLSESRIHWYAFLNFFLVVVVQSVVLRYVLVSMLRRDIQRYNDEDALLEGEESGWKLVSGDVFRKPRRAGIFAILVGTGMQLACMTASTVFIATMGFIAPYSRGWLATAQLVLFIVFSSVNGAVTAVLAKLFKMRSWKIIFTTAAFFPACMFAAYLTLNFIHLGSHAASTLPFSFLIFLLFVWICVSTPVCLLGATVGFGLTVPIPCKVNNIPRTIPSQPVYLASSLSYLIPALIPFAASFVELLYIFGSIWQGSVYYILGFLGAVYVLVIILVSQVSVFSTYFQLNALDYRWWWRSFFTSASYGVWLMLFSVYYYFMRSEVRGFWGAVLYFGYMSMMCSALALLFASIGVLASLIFVRIIYSNVKAE